MIFISKTDFHEESFITTGPVLCMYTCLFCCRINFLSRSENADVEQENREDISNCLTHCFRTKMNEPHNVDELDTTLDVTLADGLPETLKQSNAAVDGRPRTSTTNSEFDVIEFDNDVKCTSRGCGCSKESNIGSSFSGKYKKVVGNGMAGRMRNTDSSEMLDLGNTTVTIEENSPFCDYYVKSSEVSNIDRAHESDDSVKVTGECQRENIDIPNVDSYSQFSKDVRNENDAETLKIEKSDSDNKCVERCGSLSGMLEGITESFQPHSKYSINEMSLDFIEECSAKVLDTDKEKSDYHKECTQNIPADVINTCSDTRCETLTDFHDGQMERSEHQSSSSDSPGSLKMVFLPHTEFSINEVASDLIEDCSIKCQMNETNTRNELGAVQSENKAISDFIGDNDDSQTKAIERNYDKGKSASSTGLHDLNAAAESDKIKERIGLINGLIKITSFKYRTKFRGRNKTQAYQVIRYLCAQTYYFEFIKNLNSWCMNILSTCKHLFGIACTSKDMLCLPLSIHLSVNFSILLYFSRFACLYKSIGSYYCILASLSVSDPALLPASFSS